MYSNSIYASLFEEEYCRLAARPHTGHFLTIATGAFAPVGPLLAPVVKHDFQMSWALLIISKRLTLLKKLYLPAFSYPLTFSTFPLIKVSTSRGETESGLWVWNIPNCQVVGKLSNLSWMKRNTN